MYLNIVTVILASQQNERVRLQAVLADMGQHQQARTEDSQEELVAWPLGHARKQNTCPGFLESF